METMQAKELPFRLAGSDEQVVRTYACTRLRRWFSPPTVGYLTITNKRIVFHSSGTTFAGMSLLISEMPLDDVAGLSTYNGLSFNWLLFLLFAALVYAATSLVAATPLQFLVTYEFGALLLLPATVILLADGNILSEQVKEQIFRTAADLLQDNRVARRDLRAYLPYTRVPAYIGLAIIAWRIARGSFLSYGLPVGSWIFLLVAYAFIFMNVFGRAQAFSLQVGSKTMKGSGIVIPGSSFNSLVSQSTDAMQYQSGGPAEDAQQVTRELGAMVLDLQQLGDLGVQKWQR